MIIRSKAPLRIGLAGGGTDVSPYSDMHGGAILNATINHYAYAIIQPRDDGKIIINARDRDVKLEYDKLDQLPTDSELALHAGVYNRMVNEFTKEPLSFELTTYVDAPPGSGLGSSSTLVVAILGAFSEWLKLPLGEYDLAHMAFEIERVDLGMAGGKQDQYAATFGGFNFMEFYGEDKVIVNPLRIKQDAINELQHNLLLYNTSTSRLSSSIIEKQAANVKAKKEKPLEAMHMLKEQARRMKEAILKNELDNIGEILDFGWQFKKNMAEGITNDEIDAIYQSVLDAGASGGKISGAGGGGFMIIYCPENTRYAVREALKDFGGRVRKYEFSLNGLTSWTV